MPILRLNKSKVGVIALLVTIALPMTCFLYSKLVFEGVVDKKYSREELIQNFNNNEGRFADLAEYFNSIMPSSGRHTISFGMGKKNRVKLYIYPTVIDSANRILGGDNLKLDSQELDTLLTKLGWTNENVRLLSEKLLATKNDWIRTTEVYGNPIQIYPQQEGWGSFCYFIFNSPVIDELKKRHGKPIGESDFGKRVFLEYSSAL